MYANSKALEARHLIAKVGANQAGLLTRERRGWQDRSAAEFRQVLLHARNGKLGMIMKCTSEPLSSCDIGLFK